MWHQVLGMRKMQLVCIFFLETSIWTVILSIFNDFFRRMHDGGEIDVRACYTAISVASLLNILDDELVQNVGNYILRSSSLSVVSNCGKLECFSGLSDALCCQTYEGGISGEPGSEAHGGYTFCGLATMILINEVDRLDLSSLTESDQGGIFALLKRLNSTKGVKPIPLGDGEDSGEESPQTTASSDAAGEEGLDEDLSLGGSHSEIGDQHNTSSQVNVIDIDHNHSKGHANVEPLFNSLALQQYILLCSQELNGGLRDKPGKSRDHYHTCYCLSGLSVCQRSWLEDEDSPPLPRAVLGPYSNLLEPIHPLYNVVLDRYREAHEFFTKS
ncbi:protein farnesyltransferase subunit beta [Gossypium australe]|uniref:Protein farnesyltransferase subunit beta n=1 Tax=Gossypium australe TaxID=47621 RepID=A0A5B6UGL6_9ROSI|nr:protein farnesyltransferase subunit beta [Gossypium australe]